MSILDSLLTGKHLSQKDGHEHMLTHHLPASHFKVILEKGDLMKANNTDLNKQTKALSRIN